MRASGCICACAWERGLLQWLGGSPCAQQRLPCSSALEGLLRPCMQSRYKSGGVHVSLTVAKSVLPQRGRMQRPPSAPNTFAYYSTFILTDQAMLLQSRWNCTLVFPACCKCQNTYLRTQGATQHAHVQQLAQRAVLPVQRYVPIFSAPRCTSTLIGARCLHCRGPRCRWQTVCCQPAAAAGNEDQTRR